MCCIVLYVCMYVCVQRVLGVCVEHRVDLREFSDAVSRPPVFDRLFSTLCALCAVFCSGRRQLYRGVGLGTPSKPPGYTVGGEVASTAAAAAASDAEAPATPRTSG